MPPGRTDLRTGRLILAENAGWHAFAGSAGEIAGCAGTAMRGRTQRGTRAARPNSRRCPDVHRRCPGDLRSRPSACALTTAPAGPARHLPRSSCVASHRRHLRRTQLFELGHRTARPRSAPGAGSSPNSSAIDTELGVLKTGKEADVHLVGRAVPGGPDCLLAAKRYRTSEHRMFHRDAGYQEGRRTRRSRDTRAMARRTEYGRDLPAGQWADRRVRRARPRCGRPARRCRTRSSCPAPS